MAKNPFAKVLLQEPVIFITVFTADSTVFTVTQPKANPSKVDKTSPYSTLHHSAKLIPEKLPFKATAAPEIPAMRAWLSEVGIPNRQAATAHITIAKRAAQRAAEPESEDCPMDGSKFTIFEIVTATFEFSAVITEIPMKLKVAAKATAVRGPIDLVDTAVAMAFGASVQPFTRITPSVSITVKRKGRFPEIPEINSPKVMTIPLLTEFLCN